MMGTNFYWKDVETEDRDDVRHHIGKRSAAGLYCWDCGTTLHEGGTTQVHSGKGRWHEECPICGGKREAGTKGTAHVELGFAEPTDVPRTGVSSASSFTWTMMRHKRELEALAGTGGDWKCVVDEYGDEFTAQEFLKSELACVAIEMQYAREFC